MSVVAAKVYEDKITVAADSILTNGWLKRNKNFSKIANINGMIVGSTGTAQEGSLMWHYMETHRPASATEKDVLKFIVEFSNWKNGMGAGSCVENTYIMEFNGHLFEIEQMFVHEIFDYIAVGAGQDFATAALYLGRSPKEAVKVACDLSCFVCEPIIEITAERESEKK